MLKIKYQKKIPVKKVSMTVGFKNNEWYNGKLYMPLSSIKKSAREDIVEAIQLGNSNKFRYTLEKILLKQYN